MLHSFDNNDGTFPSDTLVFDAAGNLYGTTFEGGNPYGFGVVFKLQPGRKGTWTETALYAFDGSHGGYPRSGVILDSAGNLYGTTGRGGSGNGYCARYGGCGVVFKITP